MTETPGLLDKDGKPVHPSEEPQARCERCRHIAPVSKFLGDDPGRDSCPVCGGKHWEFF